ncbi:serine/threonine-protein kinase [Micromonospora sp. NPDC000663]|uniref:serine/threonine-protein kinase n=1 Tax=Micromonospora sp. NPDC000663 TaxID=3364218 RepID=UPI003679A93D
MQRDELLAGRYRLLERLGSGGMSAVHRAYDEVLERDVAVKVLIGSDANARRRIRAEALAAARLSHPHVTAVYDYGESLLDGVRVPFVVLELLSGTTLEQRLAAGPLPPRAGLRMCAEVASALAVAHAQGLVHRDIKPGNVMLTPTGAKVLDFGIAAVAGDPEIDFEGRLLGTPAYLAPERLAAGEVLPACDVYALGLLLHRALTGRLPRVAEGRSGTAHAQVHVEPDPLPEMDGVPAEVHRLYRWCLARDPDDRPPAAEAARILRVAAGESAALGGPVALAADTDTTPAQVVAGVESAAEAGSGAMPESASGAVGPSSGPAVRPPGKPRRRSWRRRRAVLAVGGAVVAAVALAGALGDSSTHDAGTPRTAIGSGDTTTVGLPRTVVPPDPADTRPPATPPSGHSSVATRTGPPTGPGGAPPVRPTAGTPKPTPSGAPPTPTVPPGVPVGARGGTVTVRCLHGSVEVLGVTPAPGFQAEAYDPGPAKRVQIELTSAEHDSEIRVHCANGRPKPMVTENSD